MAAAQSRGDCGRVGGIARERANAAGVREASRREFVEYRAVGARQWPERRARPSRICGGAVAWRANPVEAEGAAVKIRWPEGIEVELPLSLGELTLRRCLREVLTCSR